MSLSPKYTEAELVDLLKSREEKAFNYLYDHYSVPLYNIICKIVGTEALASDLLQEAFLKIWKNIHQYQVSRGSLFTWLLNIARNLAIDTIRSKDFKNQAQTGLLENEDHKSENDVVSNSVDHIGISSVIMKLKQDYRNLIDLVYFKGYTQEDAARELNIPVGTVKTRLRSALMELRVFLKN